MNLTATTGALGVCFRTTVTLDGNALRMAEKKPAGVTPSAFLATAGSISGAVAASTSLQQHG